MLKRKTNKIQKVYAAFISVLFILSLFSLNNCSSGDKKSYFYEKTHLKLRNTKLEITNFFTKKKRAKEIENSLLAQVERIIHEEQNQVNEEQNQVNETENQVNETENQVNEIESQVNKE